MYHYSILKEENAGYEQNQLVEIGSDLSDAVLCNICSSIITHKKEKLFINGYFEHSFLNPLGRTFRLGCFSQAIGCIDISEPTLDFTWFPNYSWSICICKVCRQHNGWLYTNNSFSFYGLILDTLLNYS